MTLNKKVSDLFRNAFETPYVKTADEEHDSFNQSKCLYNKCDGSGYYLEVIDGSKKAVNCKCYEDEILKRKLRKANMSDSYWNKELKLHGLVGTLLHPLKEPIPRKIDKRKTKQDAEEPSEFIQRHYREIPMENGLEAFVVNYLKNTLKYINETPREKVKNLILMGDTGRGKTLMVNIIGKTYLIEGKTVYFTTMRTLVKDVMNPEVDIEKIINETDLLIIDELGKEYHTDSGWAMTQIQELLRVRYNKKLPVICTTNFYPNEIHELYDKSLLSLFHGTYFMVYVDRAEGDFRIEEADKDLEEWNF